MSERAISQPTQRPYSLQAAWELASSMRTELQARATEAASRLCDVDDCAVYLEHFKRLVTGAAQPAINMSLANCAMMLRHGAWLNVYEAAALDLGIHLETVLTVEDEAHLEEVVCDRLRGNKTGWYAQRTAVDDLFHFSRATHYAALNVGGLGARRYGEVCVILDLAHWEPHATCFAGDTLKACFDEAGNSMMPKAEALNRFGIAEDWWWLALLHHQEYLRLLCREDRVLVSAAARSLVEDDDGLLELHLHGPVRIDQVRRVIMDPELCDRLQTRAKLWALKGQPGSRDYDPVRDFINVRRLLRKRGMDIETP